MSGDDLTLKYPQQPLGARHLFAVCRYDGPVGGDPARGFILTRGYWTEAEANDKAGELNAKVGQDAATVYFVRPVRVETLD